MQVVSVDKLVTKKILPFDLYNENGEKIFSAGEVLTPGKLLQLRYISVLYTDDSSEKKEIQQETLESQQSEEPVVKPEEIVIKEVTATKDDFADELPDVEFSKAINTTSFITPKSQLSVKAFYAKALELFISTKEPDKTIQLFNDTRDKIVEDIYPIANDITHKSQLKMIGPYNQSHGINVAILSAFLALKLGLNEGQVNDVALAALLHDIGKVRIPNEVLSKSSSYQSPKDSKLIQLHPQLGYKILKREFELPEHICKVALEHHEKNDGSGFPYGISGDQISLLSQIVSVCNEYENLISNKSTPEIKSPKDAIRVMLEIGTRWFTPDVFYTFVHMSNYNDMMQVDDLSSI